MQTIHEMFTTSVDAAPDKVLFAQPDGLDLTYAETRDLTERLATVLTDLGIEPGDRVAVQVDKSPQAICLYLATLQVGGVYLPLNTAYTGAEVDYFITDAAPRLLVCAPGALDAHRLRQGAGGPRAESLGEAADGSLMDLARAATPQAVRLPRAMSDPAAILYTSGTTGRSKGAVLTHGNLASNAEALLESWRFTADDRLIHALPIFHVHGLFVAINIIIAAGANMIWLPKFDADQVALLLPDATVLMGVPTFYTRLLKSDALTRDAAAGMRLFISGSAPLLAEDHRTFQDRTGHAILERYGMTETGMITTNPYDGARIPGAVGLALPGVSIRVTDRDSGAPLPDGQIGLVELRGPNVFAGYWQMPEKTASEFRADGFFITGDLGLIGPDGYLRIVGRDKDLIISGGYNIYPKEIEEVIDALPGVVESAVIGLPHADLGEAALAVVVPRPGADRDESAVIAALSGALARFKQPRRVVFVDELPRNVMGKVQKAELRRHWADLFA